MPRKAPPHAWKPGESGNPSGRRPGSGKVAALRATITAAVPEIIETLNARAKAGDGHAARVLIERAIPALRPIEQPAPITLPQGSLGDIGRGLLAAAGAGELAPGQAAQLLAGLGALARVIETDELEKRLAALEVAQGVPT